MRNIIPSALVGFLAGLLGAYIAVQSSFYGTLMAPIPSSGQQLPSAAAAESNHEQNVIAAVQKASPAVVSIVITQDVPIVERFFDDPRGGSPFGSFFGPFSFRVPRLEQRGTERREVGGGSGFIVSSDGFIVTNRHVVSETSADYTVFTNNGEQYNAKVVARDPVNDIAILKIDGRSLPSLQFANSDELQVGQTVIAIGNALSEFRNTVSTGVISGLSRSIVAGDGRGSNETLDEVIQTDAAINPGNSGGPLLNLAGNVVGVNVAMAQGSENIGFALPANSVSSIIDGVKQTGTIARPYIGVRYTMITPVLQEQNDLPVSDGALIIGGNQVGDFAVVPGSPADKAGLREGDIIVAIDGKELTEETSLAIIIRQKKIGDKITLRVLSRGEEKTPILTLEQIPHE